MNYYEHHLGDYTRDAAHLSMLEEGAYRRLIDAYYARESPLPLDISQCKKLARVTRTPAEHRAVEYVLSEFFEKLPDGYHQKRCDEEIQRFKAKRDAAKASADVRWKNANAFNPHMRTNSERINGKHANASNSHDVRNALQSPDTSLQTPVTRKEIKTGGGESAARPSPPTQLGIDFDLTAERRTYAESLGLDPKRTFDLFVNHFIAADGPKSFSRNWDARWRKWCLEDSQKRRVNGSHDPPKAGVDADGIPTWVTPEERVEILRERQEQTHAT